jgi:tetratricopeptide (TPR) repeat protein
VFADALTAMPSFTVPGRDRPTVALGAIDTSPENSDIARSIADELAIALSRAGASVVRQPGAARYHLIGAISGSDRQTRLTFRLIDAETGRHLTAHRSDGAPGHDSAFDEHLATKIVAAIQPSLRLAEIDRATRKPDADLSPHDMAMRAMPWVLSLDAEGNAHALDLLERAIERDPTNALATALAAWAHGQRIVYHFSAAPNEDRVKSAELARKAQALGGDATVLAVLGNALTFLRDLDGAELTIRKALAIDGGSAWAWGRSGWLDVYNGDADSAIERFKIALDLAPGDSLAFNSMVGIGCANFEAGRYSEAAHWQQRALVEHPSASWIHRTMCPAYVMIGAESEARRSVTALREVYPDLTVSEVEQALPPLPGTYCDRVLNALHSVGLPL